MDSARATPSVAGSLRNPFELSEVVEEAAIMLLAYESSLRANEMNHPLPASAPDGIYATDANGTTFINPADIFRKQASGRWEQSKNVIFSAIIAQHSLPSTCS